LLPQPLQISQLGSSAKAIADDGDLIPIQQSNGITRHTTKTGLITPVTTKTSASNGDFFLGIDSDGKLYKISKSDLLAGLSSGGSGGSGGSGTGGDVDISSVVFLSHGDSLTDLRGKSITLSGGASIVTTNPKFTSGSSFSFNGSSGYATIQSATDLDFSTGKDFTIELFARFNTLNPYKVLIARVVNGSEDTFSVDVGTSNIRLTGWNNVYINVAHGMIIDTWYYIAIVKSGTTHKLYINSVEKGSYTRSTSFPNANNFTIGGDPIFGNNYILDGQATELRISNIARTIAGVPTAKFPDN
jgi:hypothetical protein